MMRPVHSKIWNFHAVNGTLQSIKTLVSNQCKRNQQLPLPSFLHNQNSREVVAFGVFPSIFACLLDEVVFAKDGPDFFAKAKVRLESVSTTF